MIFNYALSDDRSQMAPARFYTLAINMADGQLQEGDNNTIDQANESDGADVINVSLGPDFPSGLLVVQDGANEPQFAVPDEAVLENSNTNFKFIPWENVAKAFSNPLLVDPTGYSPRK